MHRRRADAGFTLPEALIAGTLTLFLALPALHLVLKTQAFSRALESRARLTAEARQAFALIGDGSAALNQNNQNNSRGYPYVDGLRSRLPSNIPAGSALRAASQFQLQDSPLAIQGDSFASVSVVCTGAAKPIPDCTGTETRSVQGWVGGDPSIAVSNRNASVSFQITDPFQATARNVVPTTATERFRTIYFLNADTLP